MRFGLPRMRNLCEARIGMEITEHKESASKNLR
jgi:hypothetical protein